MGSNAGKVLLGAAAIAAGGAAGAGLLGSTAGAAAAGTQGAGVASGGLSLLGGLKGAGAALGLLSGVQSLTASAPEVPTLPPPPTVAAAPELEDADLAAKELVSAEAQRSRDIRRRQNLSVRGGSLKAQDVGGRQAGLFGE